MKQYVKNKPINLGFKFQYCSASEVGYHYQFDLYLSKKESAEENLAPVVTLKTTESLEKSYSMFVFIFSLTISHLQ